MTEPIRLDHLDHQEPKENKKSPKQLITSIEPQKKRKKRYNIYVDGVYRLGLSESTLVEYALFKGMTLSEEQISEISEREKSNQAYHLALNFLSHHLRSKKEVEDKLREKGIEETYILQTLSRLVEGKWIDDENFARSFVRTELLLHAKGPRSIQYELKKKGLSEENIQKGLEEYPKTLQKEKAKELAEKKLKSLLSKETLLKAKQKTSQYLYQKGFSSEEIQEAIEKTSEEFYDDRQEEDLLTKELDKAFKKYQQIEDHYQRKQKISQYLMRRGFRWDQISDKIDERGED